MSALGWRAQVVVNNRATIRDVMSIPARWRRRVIADALLDETKPWQVNEYPEAFAQADLHAMRELNREAMPLNSSDDDICNRAELLANECARCLMRSHSAFGMLKASLTVCDRWAVGHPRGDTLEAIYKRTCCPLWWRRALRRAHSRQVEAVAIQLNIVHKKGDKYVSKESLERRQQMAQRAQGMLENVIATNEDGDSWSLAELAALSVSNPSIRRGELMVRVRGLEELAAENKHVAEFVTLTCPSRMHAVQAASGERNPKYDGTMPRDAQSYLRDVWARCRSAFVRAGLQIYGLRVAEPHHDGCPHWHLLVFMPEFCGDDKSRRSAPRYRAIMRKYGLQDSPSESGAREHRVKMVSIDASKGTAAGYVAKYISKAVGDVDVDAALAEYGINADAKVRAKTGKMSPVAAWAKTHGIRQFQFFGTPPVGLWRAFRRLDAGDDAVLNVGVGFDALRACLASHKIVSEAWKASSLRADFPEMENLPQHTKPADYAEFVRVCGGIVSWREHIKFAVVSSAPEGENRYGEAMTARVVGIVALATGGVLELPLHDWQIKRGRINNRRAPWTRFNNCTGDDDDGRVDFGGAGGFSASDGGGGVSHMQV